MKKIKLKGKLKLNKITVSKLNDAENVMGGGKSALIICVDLTVTKFACVTKVGCVSRIDFCISRVCSWADGCPSGLGCPF